MLCYALESNDATGSTDPAPFFAREYAIDKAAASLLVSNGLRLAKYHLTGLWAVLGFP
ncbi:hypothetical protein [Nitrobacter sp. TKz-YC01]